MELEYHVPSPVTCACQFLRQGRFYTWAGDKLPRFQGDVVRLILFFLGYRTGWERRQEHGNHDKQVKNYCSPLHCVYLYVLLISLGKW